MSHRQVKKIVSKVKKEELQSSEEEPQSSDKKNFFADVDIDDLESDNDSENPEQSLQPTTKLSTKGKKPLKKHAKPQNPAKEPSFDDDIYTLPPTHLPPGQSPSSAPHKSESVFRRQKQYFDPRTETDKLFNNSKKAQKTLHQSGKGMSLTPSITHYQKVEYLLSMEKVSDPSRNIFFFDISKGYSKIHPNYVECIESNDENTLNQFLARYPYHVESLFQMIMVFQMQGNFEHVANLIERLLYSFQLSFHYQFSTISNDAEIDISMNSYNRIFLRTLFMHADCLGRKGCVRTALEVVKLIFSLSPRTDPLGCVFLIDYYSIRAKKFNYFFSFIGQFMSEVYGYGSALVFPHLLYSFALAKGLSSGYFGLSESDKRTAGSILSLNELLDSSSTVILICAVNWHPEFAAAIELKLATGNKKLENTSKVCEIYARRCEDIWKPHVNWLRNVRAADVKVSVKEAGFEDVMDKYQQLDSNDFSFDVRTVIPQDMEIQQRRTRGNLSSNSSPFYLFLATFLPWNYID